MLKKTFNYEAQDGIVIYVYHWIPDTPKKIKGIVQISHGMAETALRYENFAMFLTEHGYIVYANDHRGHGKTAGELEGVGYLGEKDSLDLLIEDMHRLTLIIQQENLNVPVFLFAHSMGSFAAQRYIMLYGNDINGLILSGSNGSQKILHKVGRWIATREVKRIGRKSKSEKMNQLSFGAYNKVFSPQRTPFDWLSRDKEEVDKYVADPYCGSVFTAGFFYDFMQLFECTDQKRNLKTVPKNLPIYIISGEKDPVGNYGKGAIKLYRAYYTYGIKNIAIKLYTEDRHELLHELNRKEVMENILTWLDMNLLY